VKRAPLVQSAALLPADADPKLGPLAFERRGNTPILLEDGRFLAPGVVDLIEGTGRDSGQWHPNSHRTRLLVACAHAAKDIETCARGINLDDPWRERRPIALLATPLVTLCDHTKTLCDQLGREVEERSHWPQADRDLLKSAGRRLGRHREGPLRTLRNQRTAHIDLDVLRPSAAPIASMHDLLLPPFADTLLVLLLCFNYRRVYTWRRQPVGVPPHQIELMTEYPLVMRAKLADDGTVEAFGGRSTLAEDPREPLRDTVMGLFPVYNCLASKAEPPQPTIFWRPMFGE
jgi:hypothetical protein